MVKMKLKIQYLKSKNKGFTLIEMLVSLVIFSIIIGFTLSTFATAAKAQRRILAEQQLLDQVSYAVEYMGRSLRMAVKENTSGRCLTAAGANYETNSSRNKIRYITYDGFCHEFLVQNNTLYTNWSTSTDGEDVFNYSYPLISTTTGFTVNAFTIATSTGWSETDSLQPAVTIFLDVSGPSDIRIKMQTTVSQRNIDVP
jgi:prepilin-type N-terminal cleavage/methylation domain-containing protein